ncbi:fer-1 4, partial [Brachionus plicatilis]
MSRLKTSPCLKKTRSPEWNHSIEFVFRYPSLVRLLKIELCSEDASGVRVLAKEYLVISDISNYHNDLNYLPTYGPSYIDFYNEPNNMRIKKFNSQSQEDFNPLVHEPCSNSYTPLEASGSHYIA